MKNLKLDNGFISPEWYYKYYGLSAYKATLMPLIGIDDSIEDGKYYCEDTKVTYCITSMFAGINVTGWSDLTIFTNYDSVEKLIQKLTE